jgi:hypothetical protein
MSDLFSGSSDEVTQLWDALLSRQPEQIRAAFDPLSPAEQAAVIAHLRRMVGESGWHPEQARSARAALKVLRRQQER